MHYTIDTDYAVTAFFVPPAPREDAICFSTISELTDATASWPAGAFVAVWNSLAGAPPFGDLRPVKKFETATIARKRIFAAIEKGYGTPPPAGSLRNDDTPATIVPETNDMATTTKKKGKTAKAKRAKAATATAAATVRSSPAKTTTRKDTILALIGRKKGATIGEIMEATGWQKHSVRGFIATLNTHGVPITSSKNASGERVYQGVAGA